MRAGYQVALNHYAHNALVARGDLGGYVVADDGLAAVVLVGVGVAEVDHDAGLEAGLLHALGGVGYGVSRVVHHLAAAAQDDVGVRVAGGDEDCGLTMVSMAEERMRVGSREHCVNGHLHIA